MRFGLKKEAHIQSEDRMLEDEKKLMDQVDKEGGLDKKDAFAMILSAYIVIIPVVLIALALLLGIAYLIFT